jgi:lipopolysaccharide/colanic/teichoic acid biosynthesis glycosyltransferase
MRLRSRPAAREDSPQTLDRELERSRRHEHPLALVRLAAPAGEVESMHACVRALVRGVDSVWPDGNGVVVLLPESDRDDAEALLGRLRAALPGKIGGARIACFPADGLTAGALCDGVAGLPVATAAAKRGLDLVLSSLLLVAVLPLMAICAIAIRLDSGGPIMFAQTRTGRDGRRFRMFKFRTMLADAEELKASLAHLNLLPAPDFKIAQDPRVTRVGRFLRTTSLDELPQLLNVVRGQMSLVGPRPTSFPASSYDLWHTRRLEVRPGITGLWQVEGRNVSSFDERLRLDARYIRDMSLRLDIALLLRTIGCVLRRSGA